MPKGPLRLVAKHAEHVLAGKEIAGVVRAAALTPRNVHLVAPLLPRQALLEEAAVYGPLHVPARTAVSCMARKVPSDFSTQNCPTS